MEKNKTPDGFSYTYSAGEQAEIKKIRDKYTAPTEKRTRWRACVDWMPA